MTDMCCISETKKT